MYRIFAFLFVLRLVGAVSDFPQVLIISFDGFRYNYFDRNITPNLQKLRMTGSHAEYMRNVFVTKTFPNHHSIATGVYPEVHGVLANSLYDPILKKVIGYCEELWTFNDTNLPIWILNEKAGNGRHSGAYMWPGSTFAYQKIKPTFYREYNTTIAFEDRVDTVISWFLHPETPANLIMFYVEEPDKYSHPYGPDSPQVNDMLRSLDNLIVYLNEQLLKNNLAVDVILLSDHGMTTVTPDRILNVTHIPKHYGAKLAGSSPALHVIPDPEYFDVVYEELKNFSTHKNFTVYRKEDLLDRWHFKNNTRVPPILLLADESYGFDDLVRRETLDELIEKNRTFGSHGYDNALMSMHPFFMAWGPRILKNNTVPPFDSVDLYTIFCVLLGLEIPHIDGKLVHVQAILKDEMKLFRTNTMPMKVLAFVAICVILMGCGCCLTHYILKNSQRSRRKIRIYKLLQPPGMGRVGKKSEAYNGHLEEQHLLSTAETEDP